LTTSTAKTEGLPFKHTNKEGEQRSKQETRERGEAKARQQSGLMAEREVEELGTRAVCAGHAEREETGAESDQDVDCIGG
jgi:hypothetical protein